MTAVPTPLTNRKAGLLGRIALCLTFAIAGIAWPAGRALAGSEPRRTAIVEAVDKVHQCVVSISSEKKAESHSRWPFSAEENQRPRVSGMGSGVLIDRRGYILTNHHVVDKVQGIMVQLFDGTSCPARLLQFDAVMDLAILKIEPPHPLTAIELGISSDLMVGETVITIGNAFGYENTVSVGIVSALHRDVTLSDDQVYRNLIQTDACINPGNSGGPLINIEGQLIGINVAVRASAQGIGFALPIDEVKRVAAELLSTRRLAATWHGMVALEQKRGNHRGVVVSEVQSGSPAEATGLRPGDELVRIGDLAIVSTIDVERGLLDTRPGHPASVTVRRAGQESTLALDVRPLPGRIDPPAGGDRRHRLACPRPQDAAGPHRVRLGRLQQAPRRPLRPGGPAGQPRRRGGHPEGGHPPGHEGRQPALGDDPPRQHPLRPASARDGPDPERPLLRGAEERGPAAPHQLGRQHEPARREPLIGCDEMDSTFQIEDSR